MTDPIIDRDSVIRRLGEALDMPPEAIELARAAPSIYGEAVAAHEELGDRLNAARERIADHIQQEVTAQLRDGFGDLDAPLAPGEYVHSGHACPQDGCGWILPIEWRHESSGTATRLRGLLERDRLCRAHLAEHEEEQQP